MFNSRIVVTPIHSEAVARLEWNSQTEELYVQYTSSDNSYAQQEVDFEQFTTLCNLAHRYGSWGSALHEWKSIRDKAFAARDYLAFQEFAKDAHPETMKRMAKWAAEEVARQGIKINITKQRGW